MVWRGIAATAVTNHAIGSQAVIEVLDSIIDDIAGSTIVRILGEIALSPSGAAAHALYRLGLLVVTDDAMEAGAVPEPWNDSVSWMWEVAGRLLTDVLNKPDAVYRIPVDVRVARRLPQDGMSLVLVIDCPATSGAGFSAITNLKCLCRIP